MLSNVLKTLALLHAFQKVERTVFVLGEDRCENDVEHSYMLAMIAWRIADAIAPYLAREKVLRYALVHDLVEVYAGDTYFYTTQENSAEEKVKRERAAFEQLRSEYADWPTMIGDIEAYELRVDEEARFVYALDKVMPILSIYLDGGRMWRQKGVTLDMLITKKQDKIALSPEISALFTELVALLESNKQELFPQ